MFEVCHHLQDSLQGGEYQSMQLTFIDNTAFVVKEYPPVRHTRSDPYTFAILDVFRPVL